MNECLEGLKKVGVKYYANTLVLFNAFCCSFIYHMKNVWSKMGGKKQQNWFIYVHIYVLLVMCIFLHKVRIQ
jgi:hypothetical protein